MKSAQKETLVVDGSISNQRAFVAISRQYEEWFPQLRGRVGHLTARHFSGHDTFWHTTMHMF
jgi:hypothetical protein